MSQSPAQRLAAHLINQTLASLAVLESLNVVNSADAHTIRSKLPSPTSSFPALDFPPSGPSNTYTQAGPPPPSLPPRGPAGVQEKRSRALWDYHGQEADDLAFRAGDTIIIDEEVNEQWYRGRVIPSGQQYPLDRSGLFPSNYIDKTEPTFPQAMVPYQPPGPPQHYGSYNAPAYSGPVMSMPPQQVQVVQQEDPKKHKFGKLGGQLGNAAVTGLGFGAGSAVASELVHKIF